MADIHISRQHGIPLQTARNAASTWVEQAQKKFDMACSREEDAGCDTYSFSRAGVTGTFRVDRESFELHAKLGFFLSAFKDKIESEILKNLDALLAKKSADKT